MKKNIASIIVPVVFTIVGLGFLIAGFTADPSALTDDGYKLSSFFYVMGSFFIVWPIVIFGGIIFFYRRAAAKVEDLKANGIKGKARVLSMRNTGVRINHVPQVILELDVTTEMGEKLQVNYKKCIEQMYYSILRPDVDLIVLVDPNNKQKVHVDFDATWRKMAGGNTPLNEIN